MYDYLVAHPEADPTGSLRAQGVGGPLPTSGFVPVGMVLDPRTVGYDTLDLRRADSFERDLQADLLTAFVDFVNDDEPGLHDEEPAVLRQHGSIQDLRAARRRQAGRARHGEQVHGDAASHEHCPRGSP